MKKHRFHTYLLLAVACIMLVAEAFPHHHHELRLCLTPDLVSCEAPSECPQHPEGSGMHHPGDADNHGCTTVCVTHFSVTKAHTAIFDFSPLYTFFSLIYPLRGALLQLPQFSLREPFSLVYVERLRGRSVPSGGGLRAPPSLG